MNFSDIQLLRIAEAVASDPNYLEKYGNPASSTEISRNNPTPTSTTQAGPPDVIVISNPTPRVDTFDCPSPGRGDCLSRIPREDITQLIQVGTSTALTTTINLDNVRGMFLGSMSGMIHVEYVSPTPNPAPTQIEQQQFYDELFFLAEWDLIFRGQEVNGFKNRALSDLVGVPGCCDAPKVCVDCVVPEYGGMEFRLDLDGVVIPPWVAGVGLVVRMQFSGCGRPGNKGCGCGSADKPGRNPYIQNFNTFPKD